MAKRTNGLVPPRNANLTKIGGNTPKNKEGGQFHQKKIASPCFPHVGSRKSVDPSPRDAYVDRSKSSHPVEVGPRARRNTRMFNGAGRKLVDSVDFEEGPGGSGIKAPGSRSSIEDGEEVKKRIKTKLVFVFVLFNTVGDGLFRLSRILTV